MAEQHGVEPPAEIVAFLTKVFAFADELPEQEGLALRRLVRAGLMADSSTVEAVLNSDVSGYANSTPSPSFQVWPSWYWGLTPEQQQIVQRGGRPRGPGR